VDIGVGLPNTLSVAGPVLIEWARRAENRGFAALSAIDRIAYPTYDSLTSLALAAGATSRIGLVTNILLAPLYPPVWLAKATASLDAASGGRLTLGLGVGGRATDFAAMGRPMENRGRLMDDTLDILHRAWAGESVTGDDFPPGPPPANGNRVSILVGGTSDATVRRVIQYGEGWTAGGIGPAMAAPMMERVRRAWHAAGREGEPRFAALHYFGLSDDEASWAALRSYYGFLGEFGEMVVESAARTPAAVNAVAQAYADIGITDLRLLPAIGAIDEVDRLADAVL
jgi:alkanesulfonate monooxygenase SsuD/methylene tetrahydromethanopterin reductase-like flavin-dependent oxidoreductase (luciferase family)